MISIVSLTKIHVRYEILNQPLFVGPFDTLEGLIIVSNNGEKDQKLKELYIEVLEIYAKKVVRDDSNWDSISNSLQKFFITTQGIIHAGEEQTYKFKINLPEWKRKKGRKIESWHITLNFKHKSKLIASMGSNKRNATCVLPVEGSQLTPSFGDISYLKK